MEKTDIKSQVLILIAAILWGTTGSAQAFAPTGTSPIAIGTLRMLIGGVTLYIVALIKGSYRTTEITDKRLLLIAAACMAIYQPLFFTAVGITGVAMGTVLALGSAPIFSGVIEYAFGNKPNNRWIIATLVSIIGCVLLFGGQNHLNVNIGGAILSLSAGLSYAIYVRVSQRLFKCSSIEGVNGLVFLMSGIMLLPLLLISNLEWLFTFRGIGVSLHLGVIATALGYSLFAYGLTKTPTHKAVTLTLAEPLTASVLGIFLLKEYLSVISIMGILIIICGLIINIGDSDVAIADCD